MNFSPSECTVLWAAWLSLALLMSMAIVMVSSWWQQRRILSASLLALYTLSFGLLAVSNLSVWAGLLGGVATLYLMVNAARLWSSRYAEEYLRQTWLANVWQLTLVAFGAAALSQVTVSAALLDRAGLLLIGLSACVSLIILWHARRMLRVSVPLVTGSVPPLRDLPTVTLAIAARNETHALEEMLNGVISADYPKLEVLVLDDCSQDATSQVIRSFAHDGVRFVSGKEPATGWLGKNAAYATLAEEASGELIIFTAVDTHFAADSISQLVTYMLEQKAEVVSVRPMRREFDFWPVFLETLTSFWQVVLPATPRHIPLSNHCWAIWSHTLRHAGGFAATKNSIFPEAHFARKAAEKQAYRFVLSGQSLGVTTRKRLSSQLETATRTFYPALKRRPAMVFLASLVLATVFLLPYALALRQIVDGHLTVAGWLALLAISGFTLSHLLVLRQTTAQGWWVGVVNFPILVLQDILLAQWSMLQFEFGEVNWKGRNVCYPIMEAIPMQKFVAELQGDKASRRLRQRRTKS